MKLPKKISSIYEVNSLIRLFLFIVALYTHDWFWLLACYILNPNIHRNINYIGAETDEEN